MAAPDAKLSNSIDVYLSQWGEWLDLWLESGSDAPGEAAVAALKAWSENMPSSGFEPVQELLTVLLGSHASRAKRADALLDLMVRHHAMHRIRLSRGATG